MAAITAGHPAPRHPRPSVQSTLPGELSLFDAWLANHRTLRRLAVEAAGVAAVGRRPDLAVLNRYPIDGPLPEIVNLKGDAAFAVRRRTLE